MSNIKLICGIIATRQDNTNSRSCEEFKKEWLKVIEKNNKINDIEFYFLYCDPDLDDISINKLDFTVPGKETKSNIIKKTVCFFKYICKERKDVTHVLRCNLSSFYNFPLLLDKLNTLKMSELVLSSKQSIRGICYPSGCGAVYSMDVIKKIGDYFQEDNYEVVRQGRRIESDDVLVGVLLERFKIGIIHLSYINFQRLSREMSHIKDFVDGVKIKPSEKRKTEFKPWLDTLLKEKDRIHYRCSNPEFQYIFTKLIEKYYE
jgi:septum formation topological specificity factor MinE